MAKKKADKKTSVDPETESDTEDDNENGEEHQDLEPGAPEVKRGEGYEPNPWLPGPGRARTDWS